MVGKVHYCAKVDKTAYEINGYLLFKRELKGRPLKLVEDAKVRFFGSLLLFIK